MRCPVACLALPQYRTLRPSRSSGPHPQPWGSLGMGRRGDLQVFRFLKASVSVLAAFPILSLAAVGLSPPSVLRCSIPALWLPGRADSRLYGARPHHHHPAASPASPRAAALLETVSAAAETSGKGGLGFLAGRVPRPGGQERSPLLEGHLDPSSPQRREQGGERPQLQQEFLCLHSSTPASNGEFLAAGTAKNTSRSKHRSVRWPRGLEAAERDLGPGAATQALCAPAVPLVHPWDVPHGAQACGWPRCCGFLWLLLVYERTNGKAASGQARLHAGCRVALSPCLFGRWLRHRWHPDTAAVGTL